MAGVETGMEEWRHNRSLWPLAFTQNGIQPGEALGQEGQTWLRASRAPSGCRWGADCREPEDGLLWCPGGGAWSLDQGSGSEGEDCRL